MEYVSSRKDNVLPFPIQPRLVASAARTAVRNLAVAKLISEAEAAAALETLDAPDEETGEYRVVIPVDGKPYGEAGCAVLDGVL